MNFAYKLALKIFISGIVILSITVAVFYQLSYKTIFQRELKNDKSIVDEISFSIDKNINEKVKTLKTSAIAPILLISILESNADYGLLSTKDRNSKIQSQNEKWKIISDQENPFILKYTNNPVSVYLKNLQNNLKGEYGEIFLTNKYGALVASTTKLTTFAHAHKYWWKGAYNNGSGALFFDDRGYDDSVGNYVLGVVIPIKIGNEIIGILKANLNILGSISESVRSSKRLNLKELILIRSGGLIVYEDGVEPLSKRFPTEILEKLHSDEKSSIIFDDGIEKKIISSSEIGISLNNEGSKFGGTFESIDHKKGNSDESWFIVGIQPVSDIYSTLSSILKRLLYISLVLSILLAIAALFIGMQSTKPIKELIIQADQIAEGNFDSRVSIKRNDEIGLLVSSFNKMANNLIVTTTSIDNLNKEVSERQKAEKKLLTNVQKLQERNEELDAFSHTVAHDLKNPLGIMSSFADLLLEDYSKLSEDQIFNYLGLIIKSGKKSQQIIDGLLLFASIRKSNIQIEKLDMEAIVGESVNRLNLIINSQKAKIYTPDAWPIALAYTPWIEEVWVNYISNAIKYGGTPPEIEIGFDAKCADNMRRFWVKDQGPGVSSANQKRLFNKFERINSKLIEGHGLGLSIVALIIKKLGGQVGVESELGKGSLFYFTLPVDSKS